LTASNINETSFAAKCLLIHAKAIIFFTRTPSIWRAEFSIAQKTIR